MIAANDSSYAVSQAAFTAAHPESFPGRAVCRPEGEAEEREGPLGPEIRVNGRTIRPVIIAGRGRRVFVVQSPEAGVRLHADEGAEVWCCFAAEELRPVGDYLRRTRPDCDVIVAEPGAKPLRVVSVAALLTMDLQERGYVLAPVIPTQGLAMLYAPRGLGKTWAALAMAYAVASGQNIFGWRAPEPRHVLYLDGEMPGGVMRERIASIVAGFPEEPPSADYLRLLTPDLQRDFMPNLAAAEGQDAVAPFLEGVDFLVVDNLSTLVHYGKENETESWTPVQDWLLGLRRSGKSVLLVHHAGKAGNQRGTSAREDILDTVIALRRPDDYAPDQGARFEVHLEKARGICGPEANPFEAALHINGGRANWTTRPLEDVEQDRVLALKAEGLSIRDIAEETGLSKSKVGRLLKMKRHPLGKAA